MIVRSTELKRVLFFPYDVKCADDRSLKSILVQEEYIGKRIFLFQILHMPLMIYSVRPKGIYEHDTS
jgi:hypothetical protein